MEDNKVLGLGEPGETIKEIWSQMVFTLDIIQDWVLQCWLIHEAPYEHVKTTQFHDDVYQ